MTNAKLFARLRTLIEDARDADKKHIKKLRKVLRKLKERQNELRHKLEDEDVDNQLERQKIEQEVAVISLQRGKGVEIYKQLKDARKKRKEGKAPDTSGIAETGAKPGKTS